MSNTDATTSIPPSHIVYELIEDGKILVVRPMGKMGLQEGVNVLKGIIQYLDQAQHVLHTIADMTGADLLPDIELINSDEVMKKLQQHAKLGIQIVVPRSVRQDEELKTLTKEYNANVAHQHLPSSNRSYKGYALTFQSFEEAKNFLLQYDDISDMVEDD